MFKLTPTTSPVTPNEVRMAQMKMAHKDLDLKFYSLDALMEYADEKDLMIIVTNKSTGEVSDLYEDHSNSCLEAPALNMPSISKDSILVNTGKISSSPFWQLINEGNLLPQEFFIRLAPFSPSAIEDCEEDIMSNVEVTETSTTLDSILSSTTSVLRKLDGSPIPYTVNTETGVKSFTLDGFPMSIVAKLHIMTTTNSSGEKESYGYFNDLSGENKIFVKVFAFKLTEVEDITVTCCSK